MDAPDAPVVDADSAPYWEGLAAGEIRLQRCGSCQELRFPPMPTCPSCGSRSSTVELASGDGTVYSWVGVEHPFDPRFAADVPYVVAVVELVEGPRLAARVDGSVDFGAKVRARFACHGDWTELRFAVTSSG